MHMNRVSPEDVEQEIRTEAYFTAYDGAVGANLDIASEQDKMSLSLVTFCVLVLKNGFTVTGESSCVDPRVCDAAVGRQAARQSAMRKIASLLAFAMTDTLNKYPPRYRCAESGEYVTRGYAEANPATTVKETYHGR